MLSYDMLIEFIFRILSVLIYIIIFIHKPIQKVLFLDNPISIVFQLRKVLHFHFRKIQSNLIVNKFYVLHVFKKSIIDAVTTKFKRTSKHLFHSKILNNASYNRKNCKKTKSQSNRTPEIIIKLKKMH